ncbi:hypothetical protein BS78_09G053800 [Paspalum vaginatum]|nr:hypothetical protein BS78_09G053800 [Paspalum vaginatum]
MDFSGLDFSASKAFRGQSSRGHPYGFQVIELEDRIFKFSVCSQNVGFLIYRVKDFSCHHFKCFFHLWNADGLAAARLSVTKESSPNFQWVKVTGKKSFALVVKDGNHPLSGANRVPVQQQLGTSTVFSRLGPFVHSKAGADQEGSARTSVFLRLGKDHPQAKNTGKDHPQAKNTEESRIPAVNGGVNLSNRAPRVNEDIAIVHFDPLPPNQVHFGTVREILQEYLVDVRGLRIKDIQPSPLGQAYVQFYHVYDRDHLVLNGPQQYGDITLRFECHDEDRNHRALNFNRECWVMLLNFPLDYRRDHYIEDAVRPFARVMSWEHQPRRLASVIARIRVMDLESIPHFIAFSVGDGFQGDSWTIQCEIIQHQLLGALPADEDPPPSPGHAGLGVPFDFFGYGQPGNGPFQNQQQDQQQGNQQNQQQGHFFNQGQQDQQRLQHDLEQNLPQEEEAAFDLNQPIAMEAEIEVLPPVGLVAVDNHLNMDEDIGFIDEEIPLDLLVDGYDSSNSSGDLQCRGSQDLVQISDMIKSKLWSSMITNNGQVQFSLPHSCPNDKEWPCLASSNVSAVFSKVNDLLGSPSTDEASLSAPVKHSKSACTTPLVEIEVRRSSRLKQLNKGFKKGTCLYKNCLACSASPPTITPSVIMNLGASFCKIDEARLSDDKLSNNPRAAPIARKQKSKKKTQDDHDAADRKKKPKK